MRSFRPLLACTLVGLMLCSGGCPPRRSLPLPPIPLREAARIVNRNIQAIPGVLKAVGAVHGQIGDGHGLRRIPTLDAILLFAGPDHLRLDLKSIRGTELLLGTNPTHYWYYAREPDDLYTCRAHGATVDPTGEGLPIDPTQLSTALGLAPIPAGLDVPPEHQPVQRIVDEYQQVLFVVTADGRRTLQKEYWLDRREPRLIRRVLFRDLEGVVVMDARLSQYRRLDGDGPLLPHRIDAEWPGTLTTMHFVIDRWIAIPNAGPDIPAFRPPHTLGIQYENMDIDP